MLDNTDTTPSGTDQPQSHGVTSRRTLALGGMATLITGLAAVPLIEFSAPANTNANVESIDLALIQLCDSIVAVRGEHDRLQEIMYDLEPGDPDHEPTSNRILALDGEARGLAEQIGRLPARTIPGVQARAAAVQAIMPIDFGDDDLVPINWHQGMLYALLRDLTGRA